MVSADITETETGPSESSSIDTVNNDNQSDQQPKQLYKLDQHITSSSLHTFDSQLIIWLITTCNHIIKYDCNTNSIIYNIQWNHIQPSDDDSDANNTKKSRTILPIDTHTYSVSQNILAVSNSTHTYIYGESTRLQPSVTHQRNASVDELTAMMKKLADEAAAQQVQTNDDNDDESAVQHERSSSQVELYKLQQQLDIKNNIILLYNIPHDIMYSKVISCRIVDTDNKYIVCIIAYDGGIINTVHIDCVQSTHTIQSQYKHTCGITTIQYDKSAASYHATIGDTNGCVTIVDLHTHTVMRQLNCTAPIKQSINSIQWCHNNPFIDNTVTKKKKKTTETSSNNIIDTYLLVSFSTSGRLIGYDCGNTVSTGHKNILKQYDINSINHSIQNIIVYNNYIFCHSRYNIDIYDIKRGIILHTINYNVNDNQQHIISIHTYKNILYVILYGGTVQSYTIQSIECSIQCTLDQYNIDKRVAYNELMIQRPGTAKKKKKHKSGTKKLTSTSIAA